jgi:hypothetical protein
MVAAVFNSQGRCKPRPAYHYATAA